ncbi:response regulator [Lapidilactobacillus achengensis]|uniref:Response regulator n=1 Tax=Lapidilactobacillus achengensis TaxID=2486000 RepID=A0ABW1UTD1_9LACO|nr:response regulator [Lapidilactobacillus achengensis]
MYKVFIVEDEHLIRETLRQQIMKLGDRLNLSFAGEASDGEMGLAAIMELQPDIILTDIRMPFMDGLTFAKEARKVLPWTRIIFISGFDEFEYAKVALQVHADEYLLKPIKPQELQDTLARVVRILDQQHETAPKPDSDSSLLIDLKKNLFLNELFKGELAMPNAIATARGFDRSIVGKKSVVLLATNSLPHDGQDTEQLNDYLSYLFAKDKSIIFSCSSSKYIKFLIFDAQKETVLEKSYQIANTLIHVLDRSDQDDLAVGIGPVVDRLSDISFSFEQAQELLASYGQVRVEKIISYEDNMREGELSPTHPFKMDLANEIADLTEDNKEKLIAKLMQPQANYDRTRMRRFFVLTELSGMIKKKQDQIGTKFKDSASLDDLLTSSSNNHAFEQLIREMVDYLLDNKVQSAIPKYQSVVNQAIRFINENYTDPDISLTVVAEAVSLSPAHFSTIFSQSMTRTFIEYLTDKRIKLAKVLLTGTNKKLAEIAMDIGYNDPNYFSYLFKKREGVAPTEYRHQH